VFDPDAGGLNVALEIGKQRALAPSYLAIFIVQADLVMKAR
jgi:hypothetical protein